MLFFFCHGGGLARRAVDEDRVRPIFNPVSYTHLDKALIADAIATCVGACLGTSTVTTFVESSTGISEGARTGLSSVVVAILFLLAILLAPIAGIIPSAATAPVSYTHLSQRKCGNRAIRFWLLR